MRHLKVSSELENVYNASYKALLPFYINIIDFTTSHFSILFLLKHRGFKLSFTYLVFTYTKTSICLLTSHTNNRHYYKIFETILSYQTFFSHFVARLLDMCLKIDLFRELIKSSLFIHHQC